MAVGLSSHSSNTVIKNNMRAKGSSNAKNIYRTFPGAGSGSC